MSIPNFIQNIKENSKKKFIKETLLYVEKKNGISTYNCFSESQHINNTQFRLEKGKRSYKFNSIINFTKGDMLFNNHQYGLTSAFILQNASDTMHVERGASAINVEFGEPIKVEGEISELRNNISFEEQKYFRLILEKEDPIAKSHKAYIQSKAFQSENFIYTSGLTEINFANFSFELFDHNNRVKNYLFIDSQKPISFKDFKKATVAIRNVIGFLTGYLPRNECYIVQSDEVEFKEITGFSFSKEDETISSNMEVISPYLLSEWKKSSIVDGHLNLETLNNLCEKAFMNKRFLRAITIICEGNIYPLEIRASTYSVALETLKNIINEEHQEKINPFKNKTFAEQTIKNLIEIVKKVDEENFNNKEVIIKKLQQLNQVTNKDSFKIAFEMCGLKLENSDENTLLLRNDFLHGRLPFEKEEEFKSNQELKYTTYKLHVLISALILKYCKYEGYIINAPKLLSALAKDGKQINEPFFIKI